MAQVKCSLCGFNFEAQEGRAGCGGCPFSRFCRRIKCPNCGFELAVPPRRWRKEEAKRVRAAK